MTTNMSPAHPGRMRAWLLAIRVPTLPAAVVPVLVGAATAAAVGSFRLLPFLGAFVAALLIQVGTNLANDYFDHQKGADTSARLGPTRVTQSGLITPPTVRLGMLVSFGLAALIGIYLIVVGGWPILVIGLLSIAAGILYTGGPWPFGYNGLGDLFVFVFFGLIAVAGTAYLHTGALLGAALINAVPVGMLVTAILVVNNLRDIETDRRANKRTLAVILGQRATRIEYALLVGGVYPLLLVSWLAGAASAWFWLPVLTLPLAVALIRLVWSSEGAALNAALKGTARLHLFFGLLFAVSLLL
ncbi:MAG: 1,4-dihydroxy-2-naphthoate polyprenyltransferase [Chloroflexales bacterium]|nr:1,4-dihydroxy-2-naphthoate polyprenyltransferase [Chloroflexales bacterium]